MIRPKNPGNKIKTKHKRKEMKRKDVAGKEQENWICSNERR